jgi:Cytochrome c554 and c-prime
LGGLSRKALQINTLSDNRKKELLLLDSGNLLFKQHNIDAGVNQERLTAEGIMEIYQGLGYDAVGVGPLDLAAGVDFLHQNSGTNFPWVSANVFSGDEKPVFTRWVSKKIQDVDVVITALTANSPQTEPGIIIKTWNTVLPDLLNEINETSDNPFVILLSSLTDAENRLIAEQFPNIHLIIGADRRIGNFSPQQVNSTLLTQTGTQGKYQGLLSLSFGSNRQWAEDSSKQLADLKNRLGSLNWQLKRLEKKAGLPQNAGKYDASITRLHKEKEELNKSIASIENKDKQVDNKDSNTDQYTIQFVGLKKSMPFDTEIENKLTQLKREIRELHKKKRAAAQKLAASEPAGLTADMVGNEGCVSCHEKQTEFWKSTNHAQAYKTLVEKEKSLDLQCLPCHMTQDIHTKDLNQQPLERLLNFPEELQAVGCETCHGAGKKHSMEPEQYKMTRLAGKEICLTCHTDDHDDNFVYQTKLPKVSCPAE